jgi:hypothetical protein
LLLCDCTPEQIVGHTLSWRFALPMNHVRRLVFLVLVFACLSSARAVGPVTLRDGERFVYRVSWGVFPHAGTITISASSEELEGLPQIRVVTETTTRGFIRVLYPFDGRVDSVFDGVTGRLLAASAKTSAGRRHTHASILVDYTEKIGRYVDYLRPERSTTVPVVVDYPMDLITSVINLRRWQIRPGEKRSISVLFDDEFYDLVVTAERIETVNTPWGKRSALLLVPRMETAPKGMFRRGGEVRVWLADDEQRLPLRFEVAVAVGTATATLMEYEAPRGASPETHAHSGP